MNEQPQQPYMIDVMSKKQKLIYRALVLIWLAALISFWSWWLQLSHVLSVGRMIVNSAIIFWTTLVPAWGFFFINRMKQPNPMIPILKGRVAMVVTKVPSEPWPVVRKTLEAMLNQEFPYQYAVWLADEDPSEETTKWCLERGVRISCRKGVPGYHNKLWPRREKCKEGNLSYFYDKWGYSDYDFVCQLDADHVPERSYLAEMIRPFADPTIGYVAAPSICDANVDKSWTVRARLFVEGALHGPLQAGCNDGFATLCIGSHYAVKTEALKQIGGLGPELAEDHSTTLMFNASGWKGAFALNAFAHGDGAESFADSVFQEYQWSRSLTTILLSVTPKYWKRLSPRLKIQFGFAQFWYPASGLSMLIGNFLPVIALVRRMAWVSIGLGEFLIRFWLLSITCILPMVWLQRQGWFRPKESRMLSWEAPLFQFVRWPWILLGVVHALGGWIRGKVLSFRVTPKGVNEAKPLPYYLLLPYIVLVLILAGASILVEDPGEARGYYYFALLNGACYLVVTGTVIALHVKENRQLLTVSVLKFVGKPLVATLVGISWMGLALFLHMRETLDILVGRNF